MDLSSLHERMHSVAGGLTYRALGETTGMHPETVRRYMQGQSPSAEFLEALCRSFDLNAQWLIMGRGPTKRSEARAHILRESNPSELLAAIAQALEKLAQRLDRLEVFVQTLESRLGTHAQRPSNEDGDGQGQVKQTSAADAANQGAADADERVRIIARAVTERPRSDAS